MRSILLQLQEHLSIFKVNEKSIKSFFIGGGTPSCIPHQLYTPFFEKIKPYLTHDCEITTEANPNSASALWISGMKTLGVNRISFGVQSFDKEKLKFLGRNHSATEAIKAVENAHLVGLKNISVDLIYATHLDTKKLLKSDIDLAFSLGINHLSSYALTIEENTKFASKNHYTNDSTSLAKFFIQEIKKRGFEQYEISNFGVYKSIHNLGYWNGEDYIGIGCGAVGFLENKRFYPQTSIETYIKNPLHVRIENLTQEELHVEKIFLGLRCELGIEKASFSKKELEKIEILLDQNKLYENQKRYYNTDYLLADEIALYIIS